MSTIADTYGWDTAYAIPVAEVNSAIVKAGSSPPSFSASVPDDQGNQAYAVSGSFGAWQICMGGDGKDVRFIIPIPSMTLDYNGLQNFSNASVVIEVQLEYVPHTEQPPPGQGSLVNLVVKSSSDEPEVPPVAIIELNVPGVGSILTQSFLEEGLLVWFNANLADFAHVFSTVNLNEMADSGQFSWLTPNYTGYAYIDRTSLDDSLLGVLCMTGGRSGDDLIEELSPNAIPDGSTSGFLISQERYLVELLLPSLPVAFPGTQTSDFELTTDKTGLVLKQEVQIDDIESDGSRYPTTLQQLSISVQGQNIEINAQTKVEVSPGIWSYCQSISTYQIVLQNTPSGQATLVYQPVGEPVQNNWTEQGPGVEITEIIAGIVAGLVIVVLGILTDGAVFAIGVLVIGLLAGAGMVTPDLIAAIGTDDAPSIDMLVFNSTDPIVWSDQQDFQLQSAGLNCSLQLGGMALFS